MTGGNDENIDISHQMDPIQNESKSIDKASNDEFIN